VSQPGVRVKPHLNHGHTSIAAKMPESVSEKFAQVAHAGSFSTGLRGLWCGREDQEVSLIEREPAPSLNQIMKFQRGNLKDGLAG
jgi:hypothetical protein